jgi:hypothetical protein
MNHHRTRFRRNLLVVFGMFALSACDDCVGAFRESFSREFRESFGREFRESYATEFARSCSAAAVENGADESESASLCRCIAEASVDDNAASEVIKASSTPEGPHFQAMLGRAHSRCAASGALDAEP